MRIAIVMFVLMVGRLVSAQESRGPSRVNFDERLIKGQTTKAGSVYIYDRKTVDMKSLVKIQRSFREKIIRSVFEE